MQKMYMGVLDDAGLLEREAEANRYQWPLELSTMRSVESSEFTRPSYMPLEDILRRHKASPSWCFITSRE